MLMIRGMIVLLLLCTFAVAQTLSGSSPRGASMPPMPDPPGMCEARLEATRRLLVAMIVTLTDSQAKELLSAVASEQRSPMQNLAPRPPGVQVPTPSGGDTPAPAQGPSQGKD